MSTVLDRLRDTLLHAVAVGLDLGTVSGARPQPALCHARFLGTCPRRWWERIGWAFGGWASRRRGPTAQPPSWASGWRPNGSVAARLVS